jgi:hypothetical protein
MSNLGPPSKLIEDMWKVSSNPFPIKLQQERKNAIVEFLREFEAMGWWARLALCGRIRKDVSQDLGHALYQLAERL